MNYQHRWFYVLGIVLVTMIGGYIYMLNPALLRLSALNKAKTCLATDLQQAKQLSQQMKKMRPQHTPDTPRAQADLLTDVLMHVHLSGLALHSVMVLPQEYAEVPDGVVIKLKTQGEFARLMTFLTALSQYTYPMIVLDFSYELTHPNQFLFTAKIVMFNHKQTYLDEAPLTPLNNPFCLHKHSVSANSQDELTAMRSLPVSAFKMAGYIEQGERRQALLLLPNNDLFAASVGDVLGKEQGRVTAINQDQVFITTKDHQSHLIGQLVLSDSAH